MSEQTTASPSLSEGLAAGFKIVFGWINSHPRGELLSSDFGHFKKNHDLSQALMIALTHALAEKKYLEHVEKASTFRSGNQTVVIAGQEVDVWRLGEAAFEFAYQNDMILTGSPGVPASNRFVSITDNQPDVTSAKAALDELSDAIRKTNDPLTTHPEDRIQLSKEVDAIKALISQPRIHVAALYDAVNSSSTLKFLVRQAAAGIVQRAAVKAMESLTTLWQHVSSLL